MPRVGIVAVLALLAALPLAALAGLLTLVAPYGFWIDFAALALVTTLLVWLTMRRRAHRSIKDFPREGQSHHHQISWRADNYDRSLSGHVMYARHTSAREEALCRLCRT